MILHSPPPVAPGNDSPSPEADGEARSGSASERSRGKSPFAQHIRSTWRASQKEEDALRTFLYKLRVNSTSM